LVVLPEKSHLRLEGYQDVQAKVLAPELRVVVTRERWVPEMMVMEIDLDDDVL
jgi:hypothetical protein